MIQSYGMHSTKTITTILHRTVAPAHWTASCRVCLEAQDQGLIINRSYDNEDDDGGDSQQEEHTESHCGHQLEATEL